MTSFQTVCPFCSMRYTLDDSLRGKKAICQNCRRQFVLDEELLTDDEEPISSSYLSDETSIRSSEFASDSPDFAPSEPSKNPVEANLFETSSSRLKTSRDREFSPRFDSQSDESPDFSSGSTRLSADSESSGGSTILAPNASEETRREESDFAANSSDFILNAIDPDAELVPGDVEKKISSPLESEEALADIPTFPLEFRFNFNEKTSSTDQRTTTASEQEAFPYAPDLESAELNLEASLLADRQTSASIDMKNGLNFGTNRNVRFDEEPRSKKESSSRIWKVGDVLLDGIYEVLPLSATQPYAEGGVGIVHRVRHREWDIDLAVKSPKPGSIQTEAGKQSFERECQTWIELGLHTNIVTCYLVRRIDGVPRLFAELVTDGTLRDWIQDGRLYEGGKDAALERILDFAIQFAWGLDYAHQQGVLHLDVKPSNVMTSGRTAKVTDFGLSKVVGTSTASGLITDSCEGMTPSYCSPEQYEAFQLFQRLKEENESGSSESARRAAADLASRVKITRQSDIWSWAISVLAMFHGRSPCKKGGQTAAEVFEVFLKMSPSKERPALPLDMIGVLRTCFRKNPEERPESMQVVADRLIRIYQNVVGKSYPRKRPVNTAFTAESLCNRAASMLDLNKPEEAFELLNKASESTHWHPQILFNRTLMLWRYGKISDVEALHQLEELTKYKNNDASSFYALGLLERERGNPRAALDAFHRAEEIDPKRTDVIKATNITQTLLDRSARCVGRYNSWQENNQITPTTYIDANGDYCLIPSGEDRFALFETESGLVRINFKATRKPNDGFASDLLSEPRGKASRTPFALSDDYRWELYAETERTIVLKDARHLDQVYGQRFIKMEWGLRQVWNNLDRQISLAIRDQTIDVIDLKTKTLLRTFIGHDQSVTSLATTPDGKWAVTGSFDASLKIWEVDSGRCIRTFLGLASAIHAVWIDPRRRFVLSLIQGGTIQLWNVDLLCNERQKTRSPIQICLMSSSEEIAKRQSDLDVLIADAKNAVSNNKYAEAIDLLELAKKIDGWATTRTELNLQEWIGRRSSRKGLEEIVSTATFQGHDELISTVELSYDGKFGLSAGRDQVIRLWAFPKRQCLQELSGHFDWIRSVDMTLDARFAVSGSWDQTVRLWNLNAGNQIRNLKEPIRNVTVVRFAPDGRTIGVANGNGEISLWDGASGELINRWTAHDGYVNTFQFSRDGRYLVSGGGDRVVRIWNAKTKVPVRTFEFHQADVVSAVLSTDLRWLVSGDSNGKICLFDILNENSRPVQTFEGHLAGVTSLKLFPDNKWIVSAAKDKTVRLWSVSTGKLLQTLEGNSGIVTDLAIDLSGTTIFTGSEDAVLRRWNLYWDYEYPGRRPLDEEIERMVFCLVGHYFRLMKIAELKMTPFHYYGSRSSDAFLDLNVADIFSDEKLIQRVLTEMEYRGYGTIPTEELLDVVRDVCKKWNGFITL